MFFELLLINSFSQNVAILPDAEDIAASSEKPCKCLLWFEFLFLSRKTAILSFDRNKSIFKI